MRKLIISLATAAAITASAAPALAQPAPAHAPAPAAAIISAVPLGGVTCWLEPTGFAPALRGLPEKQLPQHVGGPGFPPSGGPPVAGGQPGECLGGAENRPQPGRLGVIQGGA